MSVFTSVKRKQLEHFLERYRIGVLVDFSPIEAGITNSNYFLETDIGQYVLTLYEHHADDDLAYMLELERHLALHGVVCPRPVADRRGDFFSTLNQRPTAIIERLRGEVEKSPLVEHCAAIGREIARFHLAGVEFSGRRENPRGAEWIMATADMLESDLDDEDRRLVAVTLGDYRDLDRASLPSGAVHADLFRDNALFVDGRLSGIFDFDFACNDNLILDLAIILHDWCTRADGSIDEARAKALLSSYAEMRIPSAPELHALPVMLRYSALRFWISRLYDRQFPQPGELTFSKDPGDFRRLLLARLDDDGALARLTESLRLKAC